MEYIYLIDTTVPFKGHCQNTMHIGCEFVHYTEQQTFDEYNKEHGCKLKAISESEMSALMDEYLKGLQMPFRETTKEDFWEGFECLPPKRWTRSKNIEFFFVSECYTADLYTCFVRQGKKYYSALRSIHETDNNISLLKDIV